MEVVTDSYRARVVLELRKPGVRKSLRNLSHRFTRTTDDAQELLQSALVHVVNPAGRPWDPGGPKDFVLHVSDVMSGMASNERRRWRTRNEVLDPGITHDDRVADGAPLAEQRIEEREAAVQLSRRTDALLVELDRADPEAAAVLRAILDGAVGHPAIAARAGIETERVRHTYDRIRRRANMLLEEQRRGDLAMRTRRDVPVRGTMKEDLS
jgi:DNA-directed RNA polymerase specialized sigma24 family protein